MKASDAINLIKDAVPKNNVSSVWADLGSGTGTFTKALAELLPARSSILAIDKESQKIVSLNQVTIQFHQADFTKPETLPVGLDGILIANALHYVKDQQGFLSNLTQHLKGNGRIVIIEYDTDQANNWIPWPISFVKLKKLLADSGFHSIGKVGELPSIYNADKMYASLAFTK